MNKLVRGIYFALGIFFLEISYFYITGKWGVPVDEHLVWFQSGFLSLLIGLLLIEFSYTKPVDSLVTSVSIFFTISTLSDPPYGLFWFIMKILCVIVFVLSLVLLWIDKKANDQSKELYKISKTIYIIVKDIGSAKLLCTITYVLGILSFVNINKQWILWIGVTGKIKGRDFGKQKRRKISSIM